MNLTLVAPIKTWDEALPLGNGLQGALLWGEGGTLRFSLDRGDLWDERPAPGNPLAGFTLARMTQLVVAKENAAIGKIVDGAYASDHPTKIPAGRIELDLAAGQTVNQFELDLATATARVQLAKAGGSVEAFFCATEPVALLSVPGSIPPELRLLAPESVKKLGYAEPQYGAADEACWFVQPAAEGTCYCVCAERRKVAGATLIATTVTYSLADGQELVGTARCRTQAALDTGYAGLWAKHTTWWREFWAKSSVTVPDAQVMLHYQLVQYFYGAASRTGAPPIPLQGVWTADAGELPPWKGDYHHDLNTEMTYMGYQVAGRVDEGRVFLDFMHSLLPAFRKFAREFLETPGAAVPAVMTRAGSPMGGWAQYSMAPVNGAWVGHVFYLHWRYTRDRNYLREVGYPWCREVGEALRMLLRPDETGVLVLPVSSSPESFNNDQRAWLKPNSNYDLMCLRMLFLGNAEMAAELGDRVAADDWRATSEKLGPYHCTPKHVLKLCTDEELIFSHRHFATLMAIYPFNLLHSEGPAADRAIIHATILDIDRLGVIEWCGYSYTWMSALRARMGEPESALWYLKAYLRAFILRNGFHANGDQTKTGFSSMDYRPFTLEGNFLACAAVHEMLLQSWAVHPGTGEWGPIRVFPAMPWRWHEAAFTDLVAEGGHKVAARRENNATVWLRVTASADGEVRIRDNFDGRTPQWNRAVTHRDGADFVFVVGQGEVIEATLPKPAGLPPAPPPPPAPADHWDGDMPLAPKDPGINMRY
jgi:alpha-L-fucosidase 2